MSIVTEAGVLRTIRDFGPVSLAELGNLMRAEIWAPKTGFHDGGGYVGPCVLSLVDANLVQLSAEGVKAGRRKEWHQLDPRSTVARISDSWETVQVTLAISLRELEAKQAGTAIIVSPAFGPPPREGPCFDVFVVMPFSAAMVSTYERFIRPTVLRCGLSVGRADDLFSTGVVMADVWSMICRARLVVADCSGRNPNVFYEIGISHTVGKPTILLAQDLNDVPFDIRHRRVIPYSTDVQGTHRLEVALESSIREEIGPRAPARDEDPFTVPAGRTARPARVATTRVSLRRRATVTRGS